MIVPPFQGQLARAASLQSPHQRWPAGVNLVLAWAGYRGTGLRYIQPSLLLSQLPIQHYDMSFCMKLEKEYYGGLHVVEKGDLEKEDKMVCAFVMLLNSQ